MPRPLLKRVVTQFQQFAAIESFGGVILVGCTIIALAWANSPWSDMYHHLWETILSISVGPYSLSLSLGHWINDGLMVIFFFVVGLEIKRELLIGELSTRSQASLPIIAAIGGMVVPALFYEVFNLGGAGEHGWGIPMATDIAFAVGILTLLGSRVPIGIKIFLLALAIVDDLGAVLVIALFYTSDISWVALGVGGIIFAALLVLNVLNVRHPVPYLAFGIFLWLAFMKSGVHATVSGVLLAMTIPARPSIDPKMLIERGTALLASLDKTFSGKKNTLTSNQQAIVQELEDTCDRVESPMQSLEHELHPYVTFFIMPLFALANAGVTISAESVSLVHPVGIGIISGLVLGKLIGISLFSWLSVRMRFATLPHGARFSHIMGTAALAGIGFTMSLFIAQLAFRNDFFLDTAKASVLTASTIAGIIGFLSLYLIGRFDAAERRKNA